MDLMCQSLWVSMSQNDMTSLDSEDNTCGIEGTHQKIIIAVPIIVPSTQISSKPEPYLYTSRTFSQNLGIQFKITRRYDDTSLCTGFKSFVDVTTRIYAGNSRFQRSASDAPELLPAKLLNQAGISRLLGWRCRSRNWQALDPRRSLKESSVVSQPMN